MTIVHIQYPLNNTVYRNLLHACSKRGYKVKSIEKISGTIIAAKKNLFRTQLDLVMKVESKEALSTNIEISVARKNISANIEEQEMADTLYKYF